LFIVLYDFYLELAQYILESGLNDGKMIAITQPRRVAALTISQR